MGLVPPSISLYLFLLDGFLAVALGILNNFVQSPVLADVVSALFVVSFSAAVVFIYEHRGE